MLRHNVAKTAVIGAAGRTSNDLNGSYNESNMVLKFSSSINIKIKGSCHHGHSIIGAGASKLAPLYPHAAFHFHARTVYTNYPVAGAMRGYGAPQVDFALKCLAEDEARARGLDSVGFSLKKIARSGDGPPVKKTPMSTAGGAACT